MIRIIEHDRCDDRHVRPLCRFVELAQLTEGMLPRAAVALLQNPAQERIPCPLRLRPAAYRQKEQQDCKQLEAHGVVVESQRCGTA
jgi:hypothetical protein